MTLKSAVDAPIPKPSVRMATAANPRCLIRRRKLYRTSCQNALIQPPGVLRRFWRPQAIFELTDSRSDTTNAVSDRVRLDDGHLDAAAFRAPCPAGDAPGA